MKRKLVLLNLALLVLVAAAVWQFRRSWQEGTAREGRVLHAAVRRVPAPPLQPSAPPKAPSAAAYGEIAQEMLFSADRNPDVVVKVEPPKPLPPFPVAHGVVNFGDGPLVILSETPGGPHRGFSPGDKVGEFKLLAVTADEIVLEFDGREIRKKLSDLREREENKQEARSSKASNRTASISTSTNTVAPAPVQTKVENPIPREGPGAVMSGQVRACAPGDPSPPGAVMNGLRKVVNETPFGKVCRWEPVN